MSYTIVGTIFKGLYRFEKEILYLDLRERPAFPPESEWALRFHDWLEKQVRAGRSLGEIVRAEDFPREQEGGRGEQADPASDPWSALDAHVTWLLELGVARAIRLVEVG